MLTPRSSIQASEKTVSVPSEYQDMINSRDPCAVAVLRVIGLRPTRQRVALADLRATDLQPRVLAQEVNQRATLGKVGVSLATFYNALNQFREPAPLCILKVDRSHAYFGTSDHNHLFSSRTRGGSPMPFQAPSTWRACLAKVTQITHASRSFR